MVAHTKPETKGTYPCCTCVSRQSARTNGKHPPFQDQSPRCHFTVTGKALPPSLLTAPSIVTSCHACPRLCKSANRHDGMTDGCEIPSGIRGRESSAFLHCRRAQTKKTLAPINNRLQALSNNLRNPVGSALVHCRGKLRNRALPPALQSVCVRG